MKANRKIRRSKIEYWPFMNISIWLLEPDKWTRHNDTKRNTYVNAKVFKRKNVQRHQ